jgi:hypothetical protein
MGAVGILALLRLLGAGALDGLMSGLSAAAKWIVSDWRNGPLVVCALMWAAHALLIVPARDRTIADTEALLTATQTAHLETISNYIDASAEAQRQAVANVARVVAEQEAVTDEVTRDLRSDLAAVSARFDRLRARDAARADPGRADPAGLPGPGAAPGRVAGTPGDQDLRAAGDLTCPIGFVCLTIDQAQRASEDAYRHDRLIDWAIGQSQIRFAPAEPRP